MKRIVISSALLFVFVVTAAVAQEPHQEAIPNWSAPSFWTPVDQEIGDAHLLKEAVFGPGTPASPLPFIGMPPCRIVDTRLAPGPYGGPSLAASQSRNFNLVNGPCPGIPGHVGAYSLNITVTNTQGPGFISIYPQDQPPQPLVSTLNYVAGQTVANAAVVPAGSGGGVTVVAGVSGADLIIDINGYYAGAPTVGIENTFLGRNAGNSTMSGEFNTGIGTSALASNTAGSQNVAVGFSALLQNNSGGANTAVGSRALFGNTSGNSNVAVGISALFENDSGGANIAIGYSALANNTSGGFNIAIGTSAGTNISTGSNNIYMGNGGFNNESNTIRIGDGNVHTLAVMGGIFGGSTAGGTPVLVNPGGRLGTTTSSRRFKEDIRAMGEESNGLMELRPVTFKYKSEIDPTGLAQYGLIAEEVAEVYPELVVYGRDGQAHAVRYDLVNAMLLNEVQKQHRAIEDQEKKIELQNQIIESLQARLARLEARPVDESRRGR